MRLRAAYSLFLLAIVTHPAVMASPQEQGKSKESMAVVLISRLKDFGTRNYRPSVYVDDTELARAQNGRYLVARVGAGKHTFRAEDPAYAVEMDLQQGGCYFFRVEMATGFWKAHGRLVSVTKEQGLADLKRLTPIDASHVKDKAAVVIEGAAALAQTCGAQPPVVAPPGVP